MSAQSGINEAPQDATEESGKVTIRWPTRRNRRIHDELPLAAKKYNELRAASEVTL